MKDIPPIDFGATTFKIGSFSPDLNLLAAFSKEPTHEMTAPMQLPPSSQEHRI